LERVTSSATELREACIRQCAGEKAAAPPAAFSFYRAM
jgi:hypothetical protein